MSLAVILLAAGKGTRMNSKYQKILHEVGGKPMVQHIFEAAHSVASHRPVIVVSHDEAGVQTLLGEKARYVAQVEKKGTGHATQIVKPFLQGEASQVIVTYGDMPLLRSESLRQLADKQAQSKAALSMLTLMGSVESSFGRIVRDEKGHVLEILEVAEARRRQDPEKWLDIRELNVGVYCFDADFLWANIDALPLRQARNGPEYYLTDMVATAVAQNRKIETVIVDDTDECLGAGTRAELVAVEKAFRRRAVAHWLQRGVTFIDPESAYIDQDVTIGQDTVIWPNVFIQGESKIGADCIIGPNVTLRDSNIGAQCCIEYALLTGVNLKSNTTLKFVEQSG